MSKEEKQPNYLTIDRVTIVGAMNGYIIRDSEGDLTVVEEEDIENGEFDAVISLLYRIKEHFLQEDPFRKNQAVSILQTRSDISIIQTTGDEYCPTEDEVAIPIEDGPHSIVMKKSTLRALLDDDESKKEQ